MSATTLATPDRRRQPLAEGEYLVFTAGRVEVLLQCVRVGAAYRIDVHQGTLRIEDQCTSLDNEDDARALARGYAHLAIQEAAA